MSQPVHVPAPGRPLAAAAEAARLVERVPPVDADALERRASALAARSTTRESRLRALDLVIRCMDLTSLEGSDTRASIVALCAKAVRPDPADPSVPAVAAVCVYPQFVPVALEQVRGRGVRVAGVAGGFPAGLTPLGSRLQEIRDVVEMGADEVDVVLNRSLFLEGRYAETFEELVAAREAAGGARLKVILETGELGTYDRVRQASVLTMTSGADFVKTSTGKTDLGATLPGSLCMMEAARDFHAETGRHVGIKVAGGVRTAEAATRYVALAQETLGVGWTSPERFRIGASSLLTDVLARIHEERSGR